MVFTLVYFFELYYIGNFALFWSSNWWEVAPQQLSSDVIFSDDFGSLRKTELLRAVSPGPCNSFVLPGIRVGLVGIEIAVASLGDIFSVVSVLFIFGIKITEDVWFWGWKTVLLFFSLLEHSFFQQSLVGLKVSHQFGDQ